MGGQGSGRPPSAETLINRAQDEKRTPIGTEMFLPNFSVVQPSALRTSPAMISSETDPIFMSLSGSTAISNNAVIYVSGSKYYGQNSLLTISGSNVGIGTTSPGSKLTVAGQVSITGASRVRAISTGGETMTANVWTKVQYNFEDYDNLGEYDNVTNYRFTATEAGYYFVSASCLTNNNAWVATDIWHVAIFKNGAIYRIGDRQQVEAAVTEYINANVNDIFYMAANDYIEIFGFPQRTGNITAYADSTKTYNILTIHRLS